METPDDLTAALRALWKASGKKSIRQVVAGHEADLGRTTVHDVLHGKRSRPQWSTVWALVSIFCGRGQVPDKDAWRAAWNRARNWDDSERRRRRSADQRTPVLACDPVAIGVHPGLAGGTGTGGQPAYIERDIGSSVRAAMARAAEGSGFILLTGPQGSGKTRLALEALRAVAPGFSLACPSSADDLKGGLPPRTAVWLDNIDQCPAWPELTPILVQSLLRGPGPLLIVGTISEQAYSACMTLHDPARQRQQAILNQAVQFAVPARLSAAELARAEAAQSDPQIAAAYQASGPALVQTLTAGPYLVQRWADADPYARAMISAVVDARDAGIGGPVPGWLLRNAVACYLKMSDPARDAPGRLESALSYATAPVPGGLAPLTADSLGDGESGTVGYRAAGYLLWLRRQARHPGKEAPGGIPGTEGDPGPARAAGTDPFPYLAPDRRLAEEMAGCGYAGPAYRRLEKELIRYALDILTTWPVPGAQDADGAPGDMHRLDLVMKTVTDALPRFRSRLAAGRGEENAGGATLAARFITMCQAVLAEKARHPAARLPCPGGIPGPGEQAAGRVPAGPAPRQRETLPYSSDGPTVLRLILGSHLRKLRESKGISPHRAAAAIHGDESKVSRIEHGRNTVRRADIASLLALYGADEKDTGHLLELADRAGRPAWWHRYHDILPEWFRAYLGMEEIARCIWAYEPQFIPGLLQTEEYAAEVLSLCDFPPEEAQRAVVLRQERQRRFRDGSLELWAIVDEAALQRPVAGIDVQIGQLRFLRRQCEERPNLKLQVIPYGAGGYAVPTGFSLLELAGDEAPDVVYVENLTGALYLDMEAEVDRYRLVLKRLVGVASDPQQTARELDRVIQELEERRNSLE